MLQIRQERETATNFFEANRPIKYFTKLQTKYDDIPNENFET